MNRFRCFALSFTLLVACGDDSAPVDAGGDAPSDAGVDAAVDASPDAGSDAASDAADAAADVFDAGSACGSARPDISGISGTEGLIIGRDGTLYYSQRGAVGRLDPDGVQTDRWVVLGGGSGTVWGMVLDADNETLYVGSPGEGAVFAIDLTAATPAAVVAFVAEAPNGLTLGEDGALYFTEFNAGAVMRAAPGEAPTEVTTSGIAGANGLAFGPDGALYVASFSSGNLIRLVLDGLVEGARSIHATGLGSPDGVAFDAAGRIWVSDNGGRKLIRLEADGTGPVDTLTGVRQAASVEFGAGPLDCTDIYVASGGTLARYEDNDEPGASVPWH